MRKSRKKSKFARINGSISIRLGILFLFLLFGFSILKVDSKEELKPVTFWNVQSIDTMKYSRDLAREKLKDPTFDIQIYQQVKGIAATGATHISIATPYDAEFLPILKRWVSAARSNNLHVWYRGNFAGWEEWFDYKKISREDHKKMTQKFIESNPDLFVDGDVFTACPECENGGPGDPRRTGDVGGYREFLIEEHDIMEKSFKKISKNVIINYNSSNGDVARLIMDKDTTRALGGIVAIDHYVTSGDQTSFDISEIAKESGGKVVLSEFGAPIPDIHGDMSEGDQAEWIEKTMKILASNKDLVGMSYWVDKGGSTKLWNEDGSARAAVKSLTAAYSPKNVSATVKNAYGKNISNAKIQILGYSTTSDKNGKFTVPYIDGKEVVHVTADNYKPMSLAISYLIENKELTMQKVGESQNTLKQKFFKVIFKFDFFGLFK